MAEVENKTSDSLGDATHKEGTEYIKEQLEGKAVAPTAEGEGATTAAPAASESTPVTTAAAAEPEPIVPAQPPASNPGADDSTAGIAKDAGGVSSAAHVESPVATSKENKRKSIVGQLTGFLGFGKKDKDAKNAGEDTSVAAYTSGAAAAATGTAAVVADRTKTTVQETTGIDMGAKTTETADTAGAGSTTADAGASAGKVDGVDEVDATKQTTSDPKATEATKTDADTPSGKNETDTSGTDADKPPKPADPKALENRQAIPVAGGEKLGEKHWGESKIVPENPKPVEEEKTGVSSAEGQPSKEVSENTAKNTGGAAAPSGSKSPEGGEKKEKFMDKLKDKFKKKDKPAEVRHT